MTDVSGIALAQAALAPVGTGSAVATDVLASVQQFPEDLVTRLFASLGIGTAVDVRA